VLLAHVIDLDEREIAAIARTNTKTVMCPTAALKMGSRMISAARLPEMVQQGICVSLGNRCRA
jgi:cytosine/adenosine deaminase-related metal-dependent hydrolase